MMFGAAAQIPPFAFALDKSLLLMGSVSGIIRSALTAGVDVVLLSWGIAGPFKSRMDMVSRMFILFGGLLLIFPGFTTMSAGIGPALTGWLVTLIEKKATAPA